MAQAWITRGKGRTIKFKGKVGKQEIEYALIIANTEYTDPKLATLSAHGEASDRTRLALGGWGISPTLAMDGNVPGGGVEAAARSAFAEAGDEWASAKYRNDVAAALAKRCLEKLES